MNKSISLSVISIIVLILASFSVLALEGSDVTRTLSADIVLNGEFVDVTLEVSILNGENSYTIDEYIPFGWTLMDSGGATIVASNVLRWTVSENASDTTYTYIIKAPETEKTYTFSGLYKFGNETTPSVTKGDTSVYVNVLETAPVDFDVAYLIKDQNSKDPAIINAIGDMGLTIGYVDDSEIPTTDFSKYRLVFVPDERFDSYIDNIPVNHVKTLIMNTYYLDEWNWVSDGGLSKLGSTNILRAGVVDSSIKITEDIPLTFDVYTTANDGGLTLQLAYLSKSKKATGVNIVVSTEYSSYEAVVAKTEVGALLKNGEVANSRQVFFGAIYPEFWTADSEKLFQNSIFWLISGEDRDADGFFTDEDCNDNNAEINPDAHEIPYDGVDNSCSGFDLADVDGDGYCKAGYLIQNKGLQCALETGIVGTDCDDSDLDYNLGSNDSTKNCINEVPVFLGPMSDLTWNEDGQSNTINLKNYFIDPDEDILDFELHDTSEDKNITVVFLTNELIRFESSDNWHGTDWVIFSATDGEFTVLSNNINLTVISVENEPVFEEVGQIIVNETDLVSITLNAVDGDGDELTYSIENPNFVSVGDNTYEWQTTYDDEGIYEIEATVTDGENSDSQIIKLIINNLNRIPVVEEISDQTLDEDTQGNTSVIASDADEEDLIYEIIGLDSSKVNCEIDGPDIILLPYENWNGQSFCEVKVTDGEAEVLRTFNIIVNPINDAPVLEEISDITVNENDLVAITLNAIDPDNENLIYYISDFRFAKTDENVFEWQTTYDDEGIYEIEARVTDGIETDIQTFKLAIEDLNEPPHIVAIPDIFLEEDSGFTLVENVLSATDNDGEITKFKIANENQNNVDCEVNGNDLGLTPAVNFNGEATCVIRTYDDYLAYDETTVKIIVNNVNDAPEIKSFSPNFDPILIKNEEYNFNIEWSDVDTSAENIVVRWYVDDVLEAIGTEFNFVGSEDAGEFFIKVVVKDNFGETDSKEWKLIVTDKPIADSFEGSTTDFEGMTDDELSSVNLVLEKINYGKIEFLQPIDLTSVGDLDNYAKILTGFVVMDSGKYPIFKNQEAKITLYNIDSEKTPAIYYTKGFESDFSKITQVCPSSICSNINYSNNKLSFIVSGFSSFLVGDTLTCSQQGGNICEESEVCLGSLLSSRDSDACCPVECVPAFNDIDTCKKINNQIEIEIKNPDKNDDFEVGEKIPVEIKIKNNLDDKVNLEVGAYLYDLKEDESIGDAEDKIKIDDGDSKTIELEIEIPEDIEDNKFVILVKVEDDESTCNQDSIEIKIERKDHYVIVKEITITPQLISLGDEMNIEVQIENLGSREEDAIVLIENSELGISQKSEEFEIEEFGEEDKERVDFIIKIPENATEKEYILTAKILYNDGDENSLDKTFGVVKRLDLSGLNKLGPINLETIFLNDKTPYNQGVVSEGIILSDDNGVIALGGDDGKKIISNVKVKPLSLRLIPWLIFGIIVLFILIIIVDLANKNNPTQ